MKILYEQNIADIAARLLEGQIGVLRTDTIYGIVSLATNQAAVDKVYAAKGRDDGKSPIVLIANSQQLFDVPDLATTQYLAAVWPGKVSVILPSESAPTWIERGHRSVAYRIPASTWLMAVLAQTGPIIAPSANPQGSPPAQTVDQALEYFGSQVDFYVDSGEVVDNTPSALIRIDVGGATQRLR